MHLIDITMRLSRFVNAPPSACNMRGIIPLQAGVASNFGLVPTDCPVQNCSSCDVPQRISKRSL
eukprot:11742953-Heterocapsa_arctica.AAC.1